LQGGAEIFGSFLTRILIGYIEAVISKNDAYNLRREKFFNSLMKA